MPASKRRKQSLPQKRKKSVRKKRTSVAQRKKRIQKEVVGKIIFESGVTKRLKTYRVQEYERTLKRKNDKRKYLRGKKLSKENQKLYRYIKKYKAAVSKKYRKELRAAMIKQGYMVQEVYWGSIYSVVGMGVQLAKVKVESKFTKSTSKLKQSQMYKRAIKAARIKGYMDVLGVSKKKAEQIYKIFTKHLPGEFVLKALIY